MTFRAKPVAKRPSRAGWDADERRTALINGGFIAAIAIAIIILIGYAGWSWYSDHWGAAATVDGQVISRDDLRTRIGIETFRVSYTEQRIRDLLAAGRISQTDASQQLAILDQRRSSVDGIALERLIDAKLQASLAGDAGISVTDADVDAELQVEATLDEERHVWMIEVEPSVDPDTGQVGDAQKAAAKLKAEDALAQLKAGKSWEDIAKTTSTASSAAQAGDLSWLPQKSGYDEKFMTAVFAVAQGTPTDVIEGADGTFRIGRVTEIAPKTTDQAFQVKVEDAGVKLADYRQAVKADVVQNKLNDKVVADLSQPSKQRHVLQIFLPESTPTPDGVKVRHILFSPNHDASGATKLAANDPAWQVAKDAAFAAYHQLQLDPSKFDAMARALSDDSGSKNNGGKLPYSDPTSPLAKPFADAIFQPGLQPGQILPPVKTDFGWHIIQFLHPYGQGDEAWMNDVKVRADAGIDFAQLARDNGEGPEAKDGGDIGWVVEGQLGDLKETSIFNIGVGAVSDVLTIPNEGTYLFKVLEEQVRTPDAKQIQSFKDSGFSNWYAQKKAAAKITRDISSSSAAA
jgi:parvulin-like peptidyl-prolyl isomerase